MAFTTCTFYADANGNTYGASLTDQAGTRTPSAPRTVGGRPVVSIGQWSACQKTYAPFAAAVAAAVLALRPSSVSA
jgi:hypothetical protein